MNRPQFQRYVFYLIDSEVYHIMPRTGEREWVDNTLCGLSLTKMAERLGNPYYEAKEGIHWFDVEGEVISGHRLCKKCEVRLSECPQIPLPQWFVEMEKSFALLLQESQ